MTIKRKERGRSSRRISRLDKMVLHKEDEIMPNRHDRRKALSTCRKAKSKSSTLDQHFEETLCRVRAEFERSGEVQPVFHCVTDTESFDVPAHWPDRTAKAATCAALRDTFRRRGVNRYLFASECWVGKTPGLRSSR